MQIIETVKNAMNWRAAVKVYDQSKTLETDKLEAILEAGRMAPTAYGLQPFRIIQVENKELREKVKAAGFNQAQITEAPVLFVVAAMTNLDEAFVQKYVELTASTRGLDITTLDGFKKMMVGDITTRTTENKFAWAGRQAYIAFGTMLETAALLKVDAGPMEGFVPSMVDEILGLKEMNLTSLGLVVFGYRGEDVYSTYKKVRLPINELVIKK